MSAAALMLGLRHVRDVRSSPSSGVAKLVATLRRTSPAERIALAATSTDAHSWEGRLARALGASADPSERADAASEAVGRPRAAVRLALALGAGGAAHPDPGSGAAGGVGDGSPARRCRPPSSPAWRSQARSRRTPSRAAPRSTNATSANGPTRSSVADAPCLRRTIRPFPPNRAARHARRQLVDRGGEPASARALTGADGAWTRHRCGRVRFSELSARPRGLSLSNASSAEALPEAPFDDSAARTPHPVPAVRCHRQPTGQMTAVMRAMPQATRPQGPPHRAGAGRQGDRGARHQAAHPRHDRPEREEHVRHPERRTCRRTFRLFELVGSDYCLNFLDGMTGRVALKTGISRPRCAARAGASASSRGRAGVPGHAQRGGARQGRRRRDDVPLPVRGAAAGAAEAAAPGLGARPASRATSTGRRRSSRPSRSSSTSAPSARSTRTGWIRWSTTRSSVAQLLESVKQLPPPPPSSRRKRPSRSPTATAERHRRAGEAEGAGASKAPAGPAKRQARSATRKAAPSPTSSPSSTSRCSAAQLARLGDRPRARATATCRRACSTTRPPPTRGVGTGGDRGPQHGRRRRRSSRPGRRRRRPRGNRQQGLGRGPARQAPRRRSKGPVGNASVGGAAVSGGSVANASSVVAGMAAGFRRCYNKGLAGGPEHEGLGPHHREDRPQRRGARRQPLRRRRPLGHGHLAASRRACRARSSRRPRAAAPPSSSRCRSSRSESARGRRFGAFVHRPGSGHDGGGHLPQLGRSPWRNCTGASGGAPRSVTGSAPNRQARPVHVSASKPRSHAFPASHWTSRLSPAYAPALNGLTVAGIGGTKSRRAR